MRSLEFEAGYSRRGNLYAGDTEHQLQRLVKENYGKETNRLYRNTYSVYTERRTGQQGDHQQLGAVRTHPQLAQRRAGRRHRGIFNSNQFTDIDLADVMLHSEVSIPFDYLVNQNLTLGSEWNQQRMKDNASNTRALSGGEIPGYDSTGRSPYSQAEIFSLFAENNMELTDTTMLTRRCVSIITALSAITGAVPQPVAGPVG